MAATGLKAGCRLGWFPSGGSRGNYFLPVQLLEASALLSPTSASITVSPYLHLRSCRLPPLRTLRGHCPHPGPQSPRTIPSSQGDSPSSRQQSSFNMERGHRHGFWGLGRGHLWGPKVEPMSQLVALGSCDLCPVSPRAGPVSPQGHSMSHLYPRVGLDALGQLGR